MKEAGAARALRAAAQQTRTVGPRGAEGATPRISPLTEAALLDGVAGKARRDIARSFEERRYRRGATIFAEGDPGAFVCILKAGLVKIVTGSRGGRETLLRILKPGDVFGELLASEESRAFTAVAGTDATVDALSRASLLRILASHPAVSLNFIRVLSRRLVDAERAVAGFGHSWSYHRLANVLLRLADDHGLPAREGTRIPFALTHAEIANMIGTTRETATAQLIRFRRLGLVTREGRYLVVDRPRLSEFVCAEETRNRGFQP